MGYSSFCCYFNKFCTRNILLLYEILYEKKNLITSTNRAVILLKTKYRHGNIILYLDIFSVITEINVIWQNR